MCTSWLQSCCLQWRSWIRPLLILVYLLFVVIVVPLLIVNSVKDGFSRKDQLILIGGLFVLSAIPISIWQITQHVVHFTRPILQKHIIRILWMVPIYALNAWLSLLFPRHAIYMDSIRECYEAYVIYNFMKYLLNYLNLEMDLERTLEYKPPVRHFFPLCFVEPWPPGREFVHNCKHGILQYTVVRPITTFVAYICEVKDVYGEGRFETDVAFPYVVFINNCSQFVAMYCLVLFYRANKDELKPMRPIPKFLCIKAVIFFSFFQGVVINLLVYYGVIKDIFGSEGNDDIQQLSSKLQNFLICIEMFVAALAHHYSFSYKPYELNIPVGGFGSSGASINGQGHGSWYSALLNMLDISDVHQDVSDHLGVVGSSLSRRFRGRTTYQMARGGSSSCESVGGSERQYLVNPTTSGGSSSNLTSGAQCYQSGLSSSGAQLYANAPKSTQQNSYGTLDAGISIVKPKQGRQQQVDTPNEGAPKVSNIFNQFQNSKNLNLVLTKCPSFDNLTKSETTTTTATTQSSSSSSNQRALATTGSDEGSTTATGSGTGTTTNATSLSDPNLRKSESNSSDWLSTPDEDLGIDVKGISNDNINYHPDRRA
ncbi:transmembrane protein 184C [Culex pipiens pallens]|uniref:transmembrane protein 184C n=1 Tax=Culex pipiens pallens TaxID=42434 RepID=UPI0019537663|nr:transmembrane protein 184C [Culex pipiens pallens]